MQKLSEQAYKNKLEYIKNYTNRIVECKCGSKLLYGHINRHYRSKKHILFIKARVREAKEGDIISI